MNDFTTNDDFSSSQPEQSASKNFKKEFSKENIINKYIPAGIFFLFALFTLLACAFSVHIVNFNKPEYKFAGKLLGLPENGFDYLTSNSVAVGDWFSWWNYILRLSSWFVFLTGIGAIIASVVTLFMKDEQKIKKIRSTFIIIGLIFLICYMLVGIIFSEIENQDGVWITVMNQYIEKEVYDSVSTGTYIPFVLASVFTASYCIYMTIKAKLSATKNTEQNTTPKVTGKIKSKQNSIKEKI